MERHSKLKTHLAVWSGASRRGLFVLVVMGVLSCMSNTAYSIPSLRVEISSISSKLIQKQKALNSSQDLVNPAHRFNVSSMASSTSFAGIISEDSYAFGHKEDLGFSIFLDRRCKRVWFIRHAEAQHNVAEREHELGSLVLLQENSGWTYWDAGLTVAGQAQCGRLRREIEALPHPLDLELVVVSPLTRTLQTAMRTVPPSLHDVPFVATELCRERVTSCPADSRRPVSVLKKEFPAVDFSEVRTDEDLMFECMKEDSDACKQRGIKFLQWLAKRPETRIAVVTHSGFLKRLFEQFGMDIARDDQDELHRRPANCEMRGLLLCAHRHFSDVPGAENWVDTSI
uniref:Phosphoglycerate mutase-like protein n=1 Tax=Cryptomonas curvata TaxID=233186 RepID=A0A7S0M519_9CRYP|mmetsp:Transcript_25150/g.52408  ORF Transcript_25150/g.52408 Transcript_25150/m.52408 type:complete len:342 (+) Transcript_25150:53-1078(+)